MKWIYVGMIDGKPSAFHNKKKVMLTYLKNYHHTNPYHKISMARIQKVKIKDIEEYETYYLENWGCGYIQSKFVHIMQLNSSDEDLLEIDLNNLLMKNLSKDNEKKVIKMLSILKTLKKDDYVYTPSLKDLQEQYWLYEEYIWKIISYHRTIR